MQFVVAQTALPRGAGYSVPAIHLVGCGHVAGKTNVHVGDVKEAESAKALSAAIHAQYADEPAYKIAPCAK